MPSKTDFLRAKVTAFKDTLERTPPAHKSNRISTHTAAEFNGIVEEIRAEVPDAASYLPKRIEASTSFRRMAVADITFIELEMLAGQVLNILNVLKSDA